MSLSRAFRAPRASFSLGSSTASTSSALQTPARAFSTTSPALESKQKRKSRLVRKAHLEKKADALRAHALGAADPVLGFGPGRSSIWDNSELKSVLLSREEVWGETVKVVPGEAGSLRGSPSAASDDRAATASAGAYTPTHFNFGLAPSDAAQLSDVLPLVSAQRAVLDGPHEFTAALEKRAIAAEDAEKDKRDKLMRIVDLRNANAKGIEVENTRRIVGAFGRAEGDTGSPEVQAAILTSRIHGLLSHLVSQPRDIHNRRPLQSLIQQRAKVLKYLRSVDVQRYENILPRIGVEARSVEGEVVVTKAKLRELIRGV